jgi:hypothetical protein
LRKAEGRVVRAGLHAHGFLGARFLEDVERADASLGDALDFRGPARRHVARFHPVVDDRAVELERARHVGLGAENLDESLRAVHDFALAVRLACQPHIDNIGLRR